MRPVAKRITEPRRTPGEIRARVVRMLDTAYKCGSTAWAMELERLLAWIDGRAEDVWDE